MLIRLQCYLHVYICTCVCPWWWKPWLKQVRRELNVIEFEWMEYVLNLKKTKNWFSHVSFTELEWFILDTSGDSLNISYSDFGFNRKTKCRHQRKKIRDKKFQSCANLILHPDTGLEGVTILLYRWNMQHWF